MKDEDGYFSIDDSGKKHREEDQDLNEQQEDILLEQARERDSTKVVDKGFNLICSNCGSKNVNIDFEHDVFWCGDCKNTSGCLDHGQAINNLARLGGN